jgi:hypothetical protein
MNKCDSCHLVAVYKITVVIKGTLTYIYTCDNDLTATKQSLKGQDYRVVATGH